MNKYFECSVRYRRTDENGVNKVVTENYIVEGMSFTEAEANIIKEMKTYISEEFNITNIKVANYSEIIFKEEADKFFKAKVALVSYNEESGREALTNIYILVQADDAKEAYNTVVEAMRTTLGDYKIPSISETKTLDVFIPIVE